MALDLARVRERLPGREVVWFDTVGSTMTEAAKVAARGCASGTAVVAEQQTLGQGRFGRSWHSEKESGLYLSVVLRLPLPAETMPALTLALGLATGDAIARVAGVACDLRWPNDVLAGDRKCAGILAQLVDGAVIAGIGVNVNHCSFPPELAGLATSLAIVSGKTHSREELLVQLLESIDSFAKILVAEGKERVFQIFERSSSYAHGRRVIVEKEDGRVEGVTGGLDGFGFLILNKDDGAREVILAGGVRPAGQGNRFS
jgi:BirA family biotin operon repressor/biotin-[acetyl-CoA-carboxylase] ligase